MKNLNYWFEKGITFEEYVNSMQVNREEMLSLYEKFALTDEDVAFFRTFRDRNWRVIVLTADWCGDAMLCVPVLKKIGEVANWEFRYLIRDENLELMDQYLTNGKSRSIPIFIFIDRDGNEQAKWGPRAPEVQKMVEEMRSTLPPQEDPTFSEKQKEMYRQFRQKISTDPQIWQYVKQSVQQMLTEKQ
jgi:hypothetical protein